MKKLISLFSALSIGVSALCITDVNAAESKGKLVVLGDSISSGYGLNDGEYNYGEILGEYLDYDVENYAVPGLTTQGLVDKIAETNVKQAISDADLIVVSIGGNDFISTARDKFSEKFGEIDDLTDFNYLFSLLSQDTVSSLAILGSLYSTEFPQACDTAINNITEINNTISSLNPDADVVFQNVYDPFQLDQEKYDKYIATNSTYKMGYLGVKRAVYYNINTLNTYSNTSIPVSFNVRIQEAVGDSHVADVCSAFTAESSIDESDLTQPYGHVSYFTDVFNSEKRDFHPNQKGQLEIASAVLEELGIQPAANRRMRAVYNKLTNDEKTAYPELRSSIVKNYADGVSSIKKGDYNKDGTIDASDASEILTHYAKESSGNTIDVSKELFISVDIDGSDVIDSYDASKVLEHYAKLSAGGSPEWD